MLFMPVLGFLTISTPMAAHILLSKACQKCSAIEVLTAAIACMMVGMEA